MKKLKVGFDLDGVLLYNPARVSRPIFTFVKKLLRVDRSHDKIFTIPKSKKSIWLMKVLHYSSFMVAPGYRQVVKMIKSGQIEAHLVTARFSYLKEDFNKWLNILDADDVFVSIHQNEKDEQPHLYKAKKVKELELDVFIEDNWDIVNHLRTIYPEKNILWITNIIDLFVISETKERFLHFHDAVKYLQSLVLKK